MADIRWTALKIDRVGTQKGETPAERARIPVRVGAGVLRPSACGEEDRGYRYRDRRQDRYQITSHRTSPLKPELRDLMPCCWQLIAQTSTCCEIFWRVPAHRSAIGRGRAAADTGRRGSTAKPRGAEDQALVIPGGAFGLIGVHLDAAFLIPDKRRATGAIVCRPIRDG